MGFGARLAAARKAKQLTQEQLGKGLGTDGKDASKAVVYGWEKDQHYPRVDQLELICNKLNCSADFLLFGVENVSGLRPEVAAVAKKINDLTDKQRAWVLSTLVHVLEVAHETFTVNTSALDQSDEEPNRPTTPLQKSA
jgi:transcriptional regulator with XRE-family HTH domain